MLDFPTSIDSEYEMKNQYPYKDILYSAAPGPGPGGIFLKTTYCLGSRISQNVRQGLIHYFERERFLPFKVPETTLIP